MKVLRFVFGFVPVWLALFALLVLVLRNARVVAWDTGRSRDAGALAPPSPASTQGRAGSLPAPFRTVAQIRPWQRLHEMRGMLAQRDTSGEQEWMDLPGHDPAMLATMFKDLRRVNRWLGGSWLTHRGLDRLLGTQPAQQRTTILDVASGSADIPRVMLRWAARRQRTISIVASDMRHDVLQMTREQDTPGLLHLTAADALSLPFADKSFDIACCSLFLHHLDPDDVIAALREMRRVSRQGVLINDLVRGPISYLGAIAASHIFTRNPISRHDAPLSARRSYTRAELIDLAAEAGLRPRASMGFFGYRVAIVAGERVPAVTFQVASPVPVTVR